MKRLGTLCTTALAIAVCSFALMGCSNIDGKTGPSKPNPGSTEAAEETTPQGSFGKINPVKSTKTKSIPRDWVPTPKNSSPSTLRQTRTSMLPAWARTPTATAMPCWSLR